MAGKVSVLWYLCYPSCSATELPKLILIMVQPFQAEPFYYCTTV